MSFFWGLNFSKYESVYRAFLHTKTRLTHTCITKWFFVHPQLNLNILNYDKRRNYFNHGQTCDWRNPVKIAWLYIYIWNFVIWYIDDCILHLLYSFHTILLQTIRTAFAFRLEYVISHFVRRLKFENSKI